MKMRQWPGRAARNAAVSTLMLLVVPSPAATQVPDLPQAPVSEADGAELVAFLESYYDAFSDRCDLDLRPGGRGHFDWEGHGVHSVRVDEVNPPKRLVWSWNHEPGTEVEEGISTTVEWTLSPREGGGTILELRETGFETEDRRQQNDGGWDKELGELVTMLTG